MAAAESEARPRHRRAGREVPAATRMTPRWVLAAAAAAVAGAALAGPAQLDLAVRIEPEPRELRARGTLVVDEDITEIALAQQFDVTAVTVDGRHADTAGTVRAGRRVWRLRAAERARRVGSSGAARLRPSTRPFPTARRSPSASGGRPTRELPARLTLWHPTVQHGFSSYRVAIDLPTGQRVWRPVGCLRKASRLAVTGRGSSSRIPRTEST